MENLDTNEYVDIYTCCKGHCDRALTSAKRQTGVISEWEDISDWIIPSIFMQKEMALFNQLYHGKIKYREEVFEKLKQIILRLSQFSLREDDDEQKKRALHLSELPNWI